jgi:hypothetical protein
MAHPSMPGYYSVSLGLGIMDQLQAVASLMIPASETLPAGGDVVPGFVEARISPGEADRLRRILEEIGEPGVASIKLLERAWVYRGYYGSSLVVSLMHHHGSRYHGAPQPLGYSIDRPGPVPVTVRGSYLKTEEVHRVEL